MAPRSERLLSLMQALRRRKRPVRAEVLAGEMGVSKRSIYRDIATLKAMGAAVEGEAGLGYMLRADYWLPPLGFSPAEIEALVLGLRGLIHGPDPEMASAARDAEAKLIASLPPERRGEIDAIALFAFSHAGKERGSLLADLRRALREERVVHLRYTDREGRETGREVWPLALGYREDGHMLLAHCTLREDFRQFRIARIAGLEILPRRMPQRRHSLLNLWVASNGLPDMR